MLQNKEKFSRSKISEKALVEYKPNIPWNFFMSIPLIEKNEVL